MNTISERVAFARKSKGWNQFELSRQIGVRPQTIQSIESGKTKRSKYLAEIARVTNINYTWIMTGEGSPHKPLTIEVSREEQLLIENYRSMTEQDKKAFRQVGSAFASKSGAKGQVNGSDQANGTE